MITLNDAGAAFAADVIVHYNFAWDYSFLTYSDLVAPFTESIKELALSIHVAEHFPWFLSLLQRS